MQTRKISVLFALLLIASMSATAVFIPNFAGAHTPPWQIPTYAYITAERLAWSDLGQV
jgi:hypothetical protein